MIERLSIDLSNYCSKQCDFCYNHSNKQGNVVWQPSEVIAFAKDCIKHGTKAVSLGGGEPFEYDGVFEIIHALYPECYLSVTSNGLPLLEKEIWDKLQLNKPDKIHITIHHPEDEKEVARVEDTVKKINLLAITAGVNLLVGDDVVAEAGKVYGRLLKIIDTKNIILVPRRFSHTPSAKQLLEVAGGKPFQSPSCLLGCKPPQNFCSVSWDKKAAPCSYVPCKEPLPTLDYEGLCSALSAVKWKSCSN